MTAESDIARLVSGARYRASKVRAALSSVLDRARLGVSPSYFGTYTEQSTAGAALASREAIWLRTFCITPITVTNVSIWATAGSDDVRLRIVRITGARGNSTVAEIIHETAFQSMTPPQEVEFTGLSVGLSADTLYAFICEIQSGSSLELRAMQSNERFVTRGNGVLVASGINSSGFASRGVGVAGTLSAYSNSLVVAKIAWTDTG